MKDEWNFNNRRVKKFPLGFHSMIEKELNDHRETLWVRNLGT